ncbi:MAG: 4-(cytidine 5'-diphospho)-2-C-methyl-D-erythritol kinase, partial [Ruminiclostridium sp.]
MNLMVKAYGKVNLWLDITGRLDNGYHSLNTVMRRIDLFDEIELKTGDKGIKVSCDNLFVPSDERNIAYKAAAAFY